MRVADGRRGAIIPGEAESIGEVFGVWGRNGGGVDGIPSTDAAWESSGRDMEMGDTTPQRRPTNIQDGLSNHREPNEMSS